MASNPQTQAVAVTNTVIAMAQQLMGIYNTMQTLDEEWTDQATATTIANFATFAVNADGSAGAADASPNTAHPMSNASLSRAMSSTQITQMKTILDAVVSLVNGNAVTAQTGARSILNAAVGG